MINIDQTGFVSDRFIGENTRLIYDVMQYAEKENIPGLILLVDFEKAFDTVSWDFIDKVLENYNFGTDLKKWIKLFQHNIFSLINQGGHFSEPVNIHRGCRQGDPISSYIFILCVEYLATRIRDNNQIKGLKVNGQNIVLSQFADDTTIILDGTETSLKYVLREINNFGYYSGLKINIDKTQVTWIGSKKYSKDKMCLNYNLQWGKTSFSMLGIDYDVNLHKMVELNYDKKLVKIRAILRSWSKRSLTPIGRNTIIKSLIISQLNHLFITLPNPSEQFLKEFNSLINNYIWDGPVNKIKQQVCIKNYHEGGLKFTDLHAYISSMKCTWIRRYLNGYGRWKVIFENNFNVKYLLNCGTGFIQYTIDHTQNLFWKDTFKSWKLITEIHKTKTHRERSILAEPLWYNELIKVNSRTVFYKDFFEKGIYYISDLLDENGIFIDFKVFARTFDIKCNFLLYHGLVNAVKSIINISVAPKMKQMIQFPIIPYTIFFLYKNKKGAKDMYNIIISNNNQIPTGQMKWNSIFNLTNTDWQKIFSIPFKDFKETKMTWFQSRINHSILGTNSLVHKIDNNHSDKCNACSNEVETIIHIFWECKKTQEFLIEFEKKLDTLHISINYNKSTFLFGFYENRVGSIAKNNILVWLKYYIYKTKMQKGILNITSAINQLKMYYLHTKTSFMIDNKYNIFQDNWDPFKRLLE